jgi:hypothetical protein
MAKNKASKPPNAAMNAPVTNMLYKMLIALSPLQ